ncbi:uncharacterized protein TRAVEDRAFT_49099 [Trametes versicolor FP-101664 SS1]|uniref:uncharacterized protein n=1 Tax=Trametes versicolor (strain FP-101664) TaxID=717944 RepID=UPI00046216E4|nr:uncharacterized protein TRAVEDRAFT_49099 [Trametes versicolor FP-101664 SS1]EIW56260.1 hypothetical protein TRAVEDRAFT_49099 [Trametes versicolor FP-101664 SS1]
MSSSSTSATAMCSSWAVIHRHPHMEAYKYIKNIAHADSAPDSLHALSATIFADKDVTGALGSEDGNDFAVELFELPKVPPCPAEVPPAEKRERYEKAICSLYLRRECTPLSVEGWSEGTGKTKCVLVVLCPRPGVPLCPAWVSFELHRDKIASAARKRRDPSVETRLSRVVKSQQPDRIDAVYNGRPYELAPPEYVTDCCPAFATYVSIMEGEQPEFTAEELRTARDLVLAGMRPSDDPVKALAAAMTLGVHRQVFARHTLRTQRASAAFTPDGVVFAGMPARDGSQPVMGITEVATKANSRGHLFEMQGQLDYLAFYCSEEADVYRKVSYCPCLLISVIDTLLVVQGAVFTDRVVAAHLSATTFASNIAFGMPVLQGSLDQTVFRIGRLFRALRSTLAELDVHYTAVAPAYRDAIAGELQAETRLSAAVSPAQMARTTTPLFKFPLGEGGEVLLWYLRSIRLAALPDSPVLLHEAFARPPEGDQTSVIVMYTPACIPEAFRLLTDEAVVPGAPRLWYSGREEGVGHWVVVLEDPAVLNRCALTLLDYARLLDRAPKLRGRELLLGEMRDPYVAAQAEDGGLLLVDFELSEEARRVRYHWESKETAAQ